MVKKLVNIFTNGFGINWEYRSLSDSYILLSITRNKTHVAKMGREEGCRKDSY